MAIVTKSKAYTKISLLQNGLKFFDCLTSITYHPTYTHYILLNSKIFVKDNRRREFIIKSTNYINSKDCGK